MVFSRTNLTDLTHHRRRYNFLWGGLAVVLAGLTLVMPMAMWGAGVFVVKGLVSVAPLVVPGIVLAAWIMASGADGHIAKVFEGRLGWTIVAASAIGAVTPVCGVTVLPLMTGLLAAGVPLAPVMAFWLSSPVTDPAMLATTAATLGFAFAFGKTLAAFGLGLWAGVVAGFFFNRGWYVNPLQNNRLVATISAARCGESLAFKINVWADASRRAMFRKQFIATMKLILICLIPAFAAEHFLNQFLHPEALGVYLGDDAWWAIPLAVLVGAPAYVDGYAALPLTRSLLDHGMSPGAAMGFLVSGGVVSIWGAMAIFPVLRFIPFFLYLILAVSGSLVAGYAFDFVM